MKSDLVDIECVIREERENAVAIWDGTTMEDDPYRDGQKREKWVWLPRSKIEIDPNGDTVTIAMPEWMAKDRGLV